VNIIRLASGRRAPGCSTATSLNLTYRVGRIAEHLSGAWLDYGCADGGYAEALHARNYWPRQLAGHVQQAGFTVTETGFIWPVLQNYPWLPAFLIPTYQRWLTRIDDIPVLRRFGVSSLIIATKPTR
jgi:hypothetical protein